MRKQETEIAPNKEGFRAQPFSWEHLGGFSYKLTPRFYLSHNRTTKYLFEYNNFIRLGRIVFQGCIAYEPKEPTLNLEKENKFQKKDIGTSQI